MIVRAVDELSKRYDRPLAIEVKPLDNFYPAEGYHQDYLDKNPGGYCHIDPALFGLARQANLRPAGEGMKPPQTVYRRQDDATLKKTLSPNNMPLPGKMPRNRPFKMLIGTNTGKGFM